MQFMNILNLGSSSSSCLHCASRLHQLQRPLAMQGGFTLDSTEDQEWFYAAVRRLELGLLHHQYGGYEPYAPTDPAEPAETDAARNQKEEEEEIFLHPDEAKEEQERNFMLTNDDRYLTHIAQGLRQPSPWLLWAIREGDRSCLEELD